jgi:hypothetical protein
MRSQTCLTCGQVRSFRRTLGTRTLFAVVVTAGVWLLAIPFYTRRCTICGAPGDRARFPWG